MKTAENSMTEKGLANIIKDLLTGGDSTKAKCWVGKDFVAAVHDGLYWDGFMKGVEDGRFILTEEANELFKELTQK